MKWVWLMSSILCEVLGTICLKQASSEQASGWFSVGVWVFYLACFGFLGEAMKHFPVSTVYATWSGVGVALLAVVGVVFFGDKLNAMKLVSLALVIAGVVGLNLSGISH